VTANVLVFCRLAGRQQFNSYLALRSTANNLSTNHRFRNEFIKAFTDLPAIWLPRLLIWERTVYNGIAGERAITLNAVNVL